MPALKKELIGKSRGGNTTKIHAVVDALGNPEAQLLALNVIGEQPLVTKNLP